MKVTQSCLTLCDPMDCSLPGSSVHGIFQARILEWVAISFSRGSSPGDPPHPGIESRCPASEADYLQSELSGKLFFPYMFPYRLLQNSECSSQC